MALDGDTSFDNDMVENATPLRRPTGGGVAGNLRMRNQGRNLVTKMQGWNACSPSAVAKRACRFQHRQQHLGCLWSVPDFAGPAPWRLGTRGTAEDLDMTLRIKQCFGRYSGMRIKFEPHAMGRHRRTGILARVLQAALALGRGHVLPVRAQSTVSNLRPSLLGGRTFFFTLINGLLMQLVLPYLIVGSLAMLLFIQPLGVARHAGFVYLGYLLVVIGLLPGLPGHGSRSASGWTCLICPYPPLFPSLCLRDPGASGYLSWWKQR